MAGIDTPIASSPGVRLTPGDAPGVSHVEVLNAGEQFNLPWDRFMRLRTAGEHLRRVVGTDRRVRVLDVGGFDGALAMFAPAHDFDLLDPATTGGSGLRIPAADGSYDAVVCVDVIEHIPAGERSQLLAELARVSGGICLINFPNRATMPAQKLVLSLTDDPFIREHVELDLPEKTWVIEQMTEHGFECLAIPSTSLALWTAQFTLAKLAPEAAARVSRYLVETHREEPFSVPLYFLIICTRKPA